MTKDHRHHHQQQFSVLLVPTFFFSISFLRCIVRLIFVDNKFTLNYKRNVMKAHKKKASRERSARGDLLKTKQKPAWLGFQWEISSTDNCIIKLPTRCYKRQSIAFSVVFLCLSRFIFAYERNKLKACFIAFDRCLNNTKIMIFFIIR